MTSRKFQLPRVESASPNLTAGSAAKGRRCHSGAGQTSTGDSDSRTGTGVGIRNEIMALMATLGTFTNRAAGAGDQNSNMENDVKTLLEEVAAIDECSLLIGSMSDRIASMAKNVHTMGECADSTVALLRKWTSNCLFWINYVWNIIDQLVLVRFEQLSSINHKKCSPNQHEGR